MRRAPALLSVLVLGTALLSACGTATYTDAEGHCSRLSVQSTEDASGTLYNGVRKESCPPTPTETVTLPPSTVTETTTLPPSTVTETSTVTQTTTTTTTVPPVAGAYPNAGSTGVPAGTTLTQISGSHTATAGQVIDGKIITGGLTIAGNGVIIRNSEIYGTVSNGGGHYSFTITDSTVGAPSGACNGNVAIQFDNYTATRVKIRNFGDAWRGSSNSGVSNVLVQDSYALLCSNPGDHSDGYQGYLAGSNVRLIHNTIDQRQAPSATAPIFNADSSKALHAEDNLLAGGSFTVRVYDMSGQSSTVKGNKIVNGSWQYGPVSSSCGSIAWSGNALVTVDANYTVTSTVGPLACA